MSSFPRSDLYTIHCGAIEPTSTTLLGSTFTPDFNGCLVYCENQNVCEYANWNMYVLQTSHLFSDSIKFACSLTYFVLDILVIVMPFSLALTEILLRLTLITTPATITNLTLSRLHSRTGYCRGTSARKVWAFDLKQYGNHDGPSLGITHSIAGTATDITQRNQRNQDVKSVASKYLDLWISCSTCARRHLTCTLQITTLCNPLNSTALCGNFVVLPCNLSPFKIALKNTESTHDIEFKNYTKTHFSRQPMSLYDLAALNLASRFSMVVLRMLQFTSLHTSPLRTFKKCRSLVVSVSCFAKPQSYVKRHFSVFNSSLQEGHS